jgi:hypothetical protein
MLSLFTASTMRRRLGMPGLDQVGWYTFKCPPTPGTFSSARGWYILGARRGATLNDPGEYPASCSADPKSGRLAVTNYLAAGGGRGSVSVYENARGSPKIYADDRIFQYGFCAYDSNSDLFIDGFKTLKKGFEFAELPYGSKVFKSINLGLRMKDWAGPLRWDGQDIALADPRAHAIDRLDNGRIVGSVPLKDYTGSDFFIEKGRIGTVLPVTRGPVSFWKYPEGGSRTRSFLLNPQPMDIPFYVTVSK